VATLAPPTGDRDRERLTFAEIDTTCRAAPTTGDHSIEPRSYGSGAGVVVADGDVVVVTTGGAVTLKKPMNNLPPSPKAPGWLALMKLWLMRASHTVSYVDVRSRAA